MPLKDAGIDAVGVPFKNGVDPSGFLALAVVGGEFIHTEENRVLYYKRMRDTVQGHR